jgi:WD40 repeat protein
MKLGLRFFLIPAAFLICIGISLPSPLQSGRVRPSPEKPAEKPKPVETEDDSPKLPPKVSSISIKPFKELTEANSKSGYFSFDLSRDGSTLATPLDDRPNTKVRIWKTETMEMVSELTTETGPIIALSPDGRSLIIGHVGQSGPLKLWDTATGHLKSDLISDNKGLPVIAFSSDSKIAATAANNISKISLWETETGKNIKTLEYPIRPLQASGESEAVRLIQFQPGTDRFATNSDLCGCAYLWDINVGDAIRQFIRRSGGYKPTQGYGGITSLNFNSDGSLLVTSGDDGTAKVWTVPDGDLVGQFDYPKAKIHGAVFHPNGRFVVAVSNNKDSEIKMWDAVTGKVIQTFKGAHFKGLISVAVFSPDGRLLVTGDDKDHEFQVWSVTTGELLTTLKDVLRPVRFTADGKRLITVDSNRHKIIIWSLDYQ